MDNAVYTFEQMLHQSLEAQGTEELCKTVQRCQDRVLKVNQSHWLTAVLLLPLMSSQARRSSRTAGLDASQTPPREVQDSCQAPVNQVSGHVDLSSWDSDSPLDSPSVHM